MIERCTICGLRRSPWQVNATDQAGWHGHFFTYLSNSERVCCGHVGTPIQPEPLRVPQAFYDAFSDDEVSF